MREWTARKGSGWGALVEPAQDRFTILMTLKAKVLLLCAAQGLVAMRWYDGVKLATHVGLLDHVSSDNLALLGADIAPSVSVSV